MYEVVLDSSVLAKLVIPEDDSDLAEQLLDQIVDRDGRVVVLDLAIIETAQSIWKKHHRKLINEQALRLALGRLNQQPLQIARSLQLVESATILAAQLDRSVYDTMFVALAVKLNVDGVTSDQPLHAAVSSIYPQIQL